MALIIQLTFSFGAYSQEIAESFSHLTYKRFDYLLASEALGQVEVPTFLYLSSNFDKTKKARITLFLHGRGYAREVGAQDSMLEHLELARLLEENPQLVIIAPQDTFLHEDSNSIGQDYWLGAKGRDWHKFLGEELPQHTREIKESFEIKGELDTVLGISMGAHGALSLGGKYPARYKKVAALSPVFRPVESEIPPSDFDVFKPLEHSYMMAHNIGSQILGETYNLPSNIFITISQSDFALDEDKFPQALKCWEILLKKKSKKSFIEVNQDTRGHSSGFWIDQLPRALNFLALPE